MAYVYYFKGSRRRKLHSFYMLISVVCVIIIMAVMAMTFIASDSFISNPAIAPAPTQSYYFE